ncbi:MAG: type II toxin-antitoxin system HicA family toxin [Lachnospiraceae bacterium]|nr:type II toxin-antitoxin system HicA family toxin [Lachnospiraceae bacterium]
MSQFDKLLERIRTLDKNMRFEELRKVLEHFGYEMRGPSKGSSHMTFRKPGSVPITIPRHNKIDRVYVEMVREVVESEDHYEETGREDN